MISVEKLTALERARLYELSEKSMSDKTFWPELSTSADMPVATLGDIFHIQAAIYEAMGEIERRQFDKHVKLSALSHSPFDWHHYRLSLDAYCSGDQK